MRGCIVSCYATRSVLKALITPTESRFYPRRAWTLSFITMEKRMGINAGTQGTSAQNVFLILFLFSMWGFKKAAAVCPRRAERRSHLLLPPPAHRRRRSGGVSTWWTACVRLCREDEEEKEEQQEEEAEEERGCSSHPEIIQFHGRMNQTSSLPLSTSPPWKEL